MFPDEELTAKTAERGSVLRGERYHLQLAYRLDEGLRDRLRIELISPLSAHITVYRVCCVPVLLTGYPWSDDNYLRRTPGLYPDLLLPAREEIPAVPGQWASLWLEADIPQDMAAGVCPIEIRLIHTQHGDCRASARFLLDIVPACLPAQTLLHTEWFYPDQLAQRYRVPVFSEEHWAIMDRYLANYAAYGGTMLLTPIFTPPLDTAIGAERETVQLVDVTAAAGGWQFGFSRLLRYIRMAQAHGIRMFEFSHLFTQWGAAAAPKVVDTGGRRLFGWDTCSTGEAYIGFLTAFIPALRAFMDGQGLAGQYVFHISDEPQPEHLEQYAEVHRLTAPLLSGCRTIDALSDLEFYENGLIQTPVPSNDRAEQFYERGVKERWTYYCCGQVDRVSNRMIAMPAARERIIGMQMFRHRVDGFLHWGYNFWSAQLSRYPIDPFLCTDADGAFPAGDPFLVYPGADGAPLSSLRQHVFLDALQDMRALALLAELTSFDEAAACIEHFCTEPLTFTAYPHDADTLLQMREAVNARIRAAVGG